MRIREDIGDEIQFFPFQAESGKVPFHVMQDFKSHSLTMCVLRDPQVFLLSGSLSMWSFQANLCTHGDEAGIGRRTMRCA